MNETITAMSADPDSERAGAQLGRAIRDGFGGAAADAVVVFASAQHDYPQLLSSLSREAGTHVIAGSSSAGEFSDSARGEGRVSALGLRSARMRFAVGVGCDLSRDPAAAARGAAASFHGIGGSNRTMPYRAALVMADALAGHADAVVEELTIATGGDYRFFG
ncbi:MAG TPA: FIST N-terminal domain-containing protein, partial [Burkholderiaceae bacterium]|nr:FIST N-terminal domain-containing protein [Burkholderiaceae bacterium]